MMKLILTLVFVGVCACAELPLAPPPYHQSELDLHEAAQKLKVHVLSMGAGIPDLTDYRRDYAVIVNVIYGFAVDGWNGFPLFSELYPQELNKTVPEALSEPQKVVDGIKKLINVFKNKTKLIQDLVQQSCAIVNKQCDQIIEEAVLIGGKPLKKQAELLLAGGEAAAAYLQKHEEFLAVSKDHSGHQYVVGGVDKLEDPITKLAYLFRILQYSG